MYELAGFAGERSFAPAIQAEIRFLGKSFRGSFLLIDDVCGILGRNVLNSVCLQLNGPAQSWEEL